MPNGKKIARQLTNEAALQSKLARELGGVGSKGGKPAAPKTRTNVPKTPQANAGQVVLRAKTGKQKTYSRGVVECNPQSCDCHTREDGPHSPFGFALSQLDPFRYSGVRVPDDNTSLSTAFQSRTIMNVTQAGGHITPAGLYWFGAFPTPVGHISTLQVFTGTFLFEALFEMSDDHIIQSTVGGPIDWYCNVDGSLQYGELITGGVGWRMKPWRLDSDDNEASPRWAYCLDYNAAISVVYTVTFGVELTRASAGNDITASVFFENGTIITSAAFGVAGAYDATGAVAVPANSGRFIGFFVTTSLMVSNVSVVMGTLASTTTYPIVDFDMADNNLGVLTESATGIRCVSMATLATWQGSSLNNAGNIMANYVPPDHHSSVVPLDGLANTYKPYTGASKEGAFVWWRRDDPYEDDVYRPVRRLDLTWQGWCCFAGQCDGTVAANGFRVTVCVNWEYLTQTPALAPSPSPADQVAYNAAHYLMMKLPMASGNPRHWDAIKSALAGAFKHFPTILAVLNSLKPAMELGASLLI